MSAESPRRTVRSGGIMVRPQPVSDKSVMETVVDFIQDVASSTSSGKCGPTKGEIKEKIHWVRFEKTDINDLNGNPDYSCNQAPPLLLVLGYANGAQIWAIAVSGEAHEVLSLRQCPIRFLQVLPTPQQLKQDKFDKKRPLVAVCDANSSGRPYSSLRFVSLRSSEDVHQINFDQPLADLKSNDRVLAASYQEMIRVFDACSLTEMFRVSACYPAPGRNPNPMALGPRWLAYADKQLVPVHQSCGGVSGDGGQSYAATVISAAKSLSKGLAFFSDTVTSTLAGTRPTAPRSSASQQQQQHQGGRPGIVTVIDVNSVNRGQLSVREDCDGEGLIAHFPAHATEPVTAMEFDPSGSMLLTADRLGHHFHLFRIMAHPISCSLGAVHHLYTLYRGDTTAKVQDLTFSLDSRWVAISSLRGTTHVFPVTPYGGPVTVRTHVSPRVVNRASRFHRSAGLDDMPPGRPTAARDSPHASPSSSPSRHDPMRQLLHHQHNTLNSQLCNPRLPPYPHPTTVTPLVQMRQGLHLLGNPAGASSGGGSLGGSSSMAGSSKGGQSQQQGSSGGVASGDVVCVAACFAKSRGWVVGSPNMGRDKEEEKRCIESLFIINKSGELLEHTLEPQIKAGIDKGSEDSAIEVVHSPKAQWNLGRVASSAELRPPLSSSNPLILASDAVTNQKPSEAFSYPVSRQESRESLSSDHSSSDPDTDQWLSQVEIITHSGPHRRLWMGPQFSFKTFQGTSSTTTVYPSNSSVLLSNSPDTSIMDDAEADLHSLKISQRSPPVNMPASHRASETGSPAPTFIEAGSYDHYLVEAFPSLSAAEPPPTSSSVGPGEEAEDQLREDIADAMNEATHASAHPTHAHTLARHHRDLDHGGSFETLSTSSGSASSSTRPHSFDARCSPTHNIEHVLVFPGSGGSPDE